MPGARLASEAFAARSRRRSRRRAQRASGEGALEQSCPKLNRLALDHHDVDSGKRARRRATRRASPRAAIHALRICAPAAVDDARTRPDGSPVQRSVSKPCSRRKATYCSKRKRWLGTRPGGWTEANRILRLGGRAQLSSQTGGSPLVSSMSPNSCAQPRADLLGPRPPSGRVPPRAAPARTCRTRAGPSRDPPMRPRPRCRGGRCRISPSMPIALITLSSQLVDGVGLVGADVEDLVVGLRVLRSTAAI